MVQCEECGDNEISSEKSDSCRQCPANSGEAANDQHTKCEPCAAGTYKNSTMVQCEECGDNEISSENSDSCRQCPANSGETANDQHTKCEPCAAGTYKNSTMVQCEECGDNEISSENSDSCRQCPANSGETANDQHTKCEPCAAGTYKNSTMAQCEECGDNEISSENSYSCRQCPANSGETANDQHTKCEPCAAGTYKNSTMAQCEECGDNEISSENSDSCRQCPANSGETANDQHTKCEPCAAGTYKNSTMAQCEECGDNEISSENSDSCRQCPANSGETANDQHTKCEPCAAGTYKNSTMVQCEECGDNEISSEKSDSCRQCPANSGETANDQHTKCERCTGLPPEDPSLVTSVEFPVFQGTKVTVWCDSNSNTELGGDAVIVCDEDYDYLYDKKPVCVERGTCRELMGDMHLITDAIFPVPSGTLVYLGCQQGYHFASGSKVITCVQYNQYNYSSTPICEKDTCTSLPDIFDIETTTTFPVNHGESIHISCTDGYQLSGDNVLTCVKDRTFTYQTVPHCVLNTCTSLPPLPNIETDALFPVVVSTRVRVRCAEGYTLLGDSVVTCVQGTHFNMTNTPSCQILILTDICKSMLVADDLLHNGTYPMVYGTPVGVWCRDGLKLVGSEVVYCDQGRNYLYNIRPYCVNPCK
ncbi:hypothetical protein ACHWQZ_G000328 [Mnemiopsis leidyi]